MPAKNRIFVLLLAVFMIFSMISCGESPAEMPVTETPDASAAPTVPEIPEAPEGSAEPEAPAEATIAGLPVSKINIIYPAADSNGESAFAREIGSAIAESYGVTVPVLPDNEAVREESKLLVGNCAAVAGPTLPAYLTNGESCLVAENNAVQVTGVDKLGLYGAVQEFISRIRATGGENLELPLAEIFTAEHETTRVMTFNVLGSQKNYERTTRVKTMITNYMPDSLGLQEADQSWINILQGLIIDQNLPYEIVGEYAQPGSKGACSAILYRTDKFTLLDSGTRWLSPTPDVSSRFDGAQSYRMCSYAVLQNKETGKTFVHINTHLDTNTHLQGKTRNQQAEVLAEIIQNFREYPVIVTGDFNSRPNTEPHKLMHEIGLVSSGDVAVQKHGNETFHDYGEAAPDCIIDYIFIDPDQAAATNYRVCNEKINGNYASDHHPVIADVIIW